MEKNAFDPLRKIIAERLQILIQQKFNLELKTGPLSFELIPPPEEKLGDLAFGLFSLAKILKLPPPKMAETLSLAWNEIYSNDAEAKNFGPYLNFFMNPKFMGQTSLAPFLQGRFFAHALYSDAPKTMIEYSQPNTHKEMHVGHMRNLCLGDALIKILKFSGTEVISSTFPGDVGTHVAKCLWYLNKKNLVAPETDLVNKGVWLGQIYSAANNLLESERGTEQEPKNREELTSILKELEKKSGPSFELWQETRLWSKSLMEHVYTWARVHFDQWYWESEVDSASVKLVKEYQDKGLFHLSEGATGLDLSEYKLGFCMLLKTDGTGLYATKDIELARRKFQDFKIEKSIYIVDKRQALHFAQVFKTLELMGFEQAKNCYHLQYDFVELPDGPMSSRKGNIVPLLTLIHKMEEKIIADYLERYRGQWSDDLITQTAQIVAEGAIKYGMLRIDTNKKIVFDMNEWLKLDGESGPYIQYCFARIQSMLNKIILPTELTTDSIPWAELTHPTEKYLMSKITQYLPVVALSADQMKTHPLCNYLYDLGKAFNSFYAECSIAHAETAELKAARWYLAQTVAKVLEHGLELLGIRAPQQM